MSSDCVADAPAADQHSPAAFDPDFARIFLYEARDGEVVRGPGQYILRKSSLNKCQEPDARGFLKVYLALEYWSAPEAQVVKALLEWNPREHVWLCENSAKRWPTLRDMKTDLGDLMKTPVDPQCALLAEVPAVSAPPSSRIPASSPAPASEDAPVSASVESSIPSKHTQEPQPHQAAAPTSTVRVNPNIYQKGIRGSHAAPPVSVPAPSEARVGPEAVAAVGSSSSPSSYPVPSTRGVTEVAELEVALQHSSFSDSPADAAGPSRELLTPAGALPPSEFILATPLTADDPAPHLSSTAPAALSSAANPASSAANPAPAATSLLRTGTRVRGGQDRGSHYRAAPGPRAAAAGIMRGSSDPGPLTTSAPPVAPCPPAETGGAPYATPVSHTLMM